MADERRHVTLSKSDRETPVGRELIDLLTELSDDGNVSREEMERLRRWLEVDHGVALTVSTRLPSKLMRLEMADGLRETMKGAVVRTE